MSPGGGKFKALHFLGAGFLLLQLALVIRARFVEERFFCWAPFDEATHFDTTVTIGEKTLTSAEIDQRYRYWSSGWENRSIHNFIGMVRRYETTHGLRDQAQVKVTYSFNGHPVRTWRWPEPQ